MLPWPFCVQGVAREALFLAGCVPQGREVQGVMGCLRPIMGNRRVRVHHSTADDSYYFRGAAFSAKLWVASSVYQASTMLAGAWFVDIQNWEVQQVQQLQVITMKTK